MKAAYGYLGVVLAVCLVGPRLSLANADYDPFSCAEPLVREAFGTSISQRKVPRYSTSIPKDLGELAVPEALAFVGSQTTDHQMRVIFSFSGTRQAGHAVGIEMLKTSGWTILEATNARRGYRGFLPAGVAREHVAACRSGSQLQVQLVARSATRGAFVELFAPVEQSPQTCEDLQRLSSVEDRYDAGTLAGELPVLELPEASQSSSMGSGGSNDEYGAHVVATLSMSREAFFRFLADQIETQGWIPDTAWSGTRSTGAVWTKFSAESGTLFGVLHVIEAGSERFNVRLNVSKLSDRRAGSFRISG
ncbi:MAG: hypothetical protein AAF515_01075 [Pseudomonadota bacterium]